jgi:hypothetical protein
MMQAAALLVVVPLPILLPIARPLGYNVSRTSHAVALCG